MTQKLHFQGPVLRKDLRSTCPLQFGDGNWKGPMWSQTRDPGCTRWVHVCLTSEDPEDPVCTWTRSTDVRGCSASLVPVDRDGWIAALSADMRVHSSFLQFQPVL